MKKISFSFKIYEEENKRYFVCITFSQIIDFINQGFQYYYALFYAIIDTTDETSALLSVWESGAFLNG
jgi:hypothetical protein